MTIRHLPQTALLLAAAGLAACSETARPPETSATPQVTSVPVTMPVTSVPVPPREVPSVMVEDPVVVPAADVPVSPATAGSAPAIVDAPPELERTATGPVRSLRTAPGRAGVLPHYDPGSLSGRIRARACYETALRADPTLRGSVTVRFIIAKDGSVVHASEHGSTVKDPVMRACVVRSFYGLSFPAPQGGVVTVTYPLHFAPPDQRP